MMRDRVDLPAPLAPTSAWTSPPDSAKLVPASAVVAPKRFQMSESASRGYSPNTVLRIVGSSWAMLSCVTTWIGTRICFSGVLPDR
jgi:hypothetical protein